MEIKGLDMIRPVDPAARELPGTGHADRAGGSSPTFGEALENAIREVESTTATADAKAVAYVSGEGEDLHNVLLAMERADLTFQTMLQVRNKLLDAYREIMRMQV